MRDGSLSRGGRRSWPSTRPLQSFGWASAGYTKFQEDAAPVPTSLVGKLLRLPIRLLEAVGKLTLHYPAWFFVPALLGRLEWFLLPYLAAHTLYLGRSWLGVIWKLGR